MTYGLQIELVFKNGAERTLRNVTDISYAFGNTFTTLFKERVVFRSTFRNETNAFYLDTVKTLTEKWEDHVEWTQY